MRALRLGILLAAVLAGCGGTTFVRVAPLYADDPYWKAVTPKPAAGILVTEGDLHRKYRAVARVIVETYDTRPVLHEDALRAEAAKIGADAVIKVTARTSYQGQDSGMMTTGNPVYGNMQTTSYSEPELLRVVEGVAVVYEP